MAPKRKVASAEDSDTSTEARKVPKTKAARGKAQKQAPKKEESIDSDDEKATPSKAKNMLPWKASEDLLILEDLIKSYKPDWQNLADRIDCLDDGQQRTKQSVRKHWEQTLQKKILALAQASKSSS